MILNSRRKKKAQAATEYLMTYGWAIVAIAVVGTLLYTQIFSTRRCSEPLANGFPVVDSLTPYESQFKIYGTNGNADIILKNNLGVEVTLTGIDGGGTSPSSGLSVIFRPGEERQVSTANNVFQTGIGGECYSNVDVIFIYDVSNGLTGIKSRGNFNGKYY